MKEMAKRKIKKEEHKSVMYDRSDKFGHAGYIWDLSKYT